MKAVRFEEYGDVDVLEFIGNNVVATHLEIRKIECFQKSRVYIGGHHLPG